MGIAEQLEPVMTDRRQGAQTCDVGLMPGAAPRCRWCMKAGHAKTASRAGSGKSPETQQLQWRACFAEREQKTQGLPAFPAPGPGRGPLPNLKEGRNDKVDHTRITGETSLAQRYTHWAERLAVQRICEWLALVLKKFVVPHTVWVVCWQCECMFTVPQTWFRWLCLRVHRLPPLFVTGVLEPVLFIEIFHMSCVPLRLVDSGLDPWEILELFSWDNGGIRPVVVSGKVPWPTDTAVRSPERRRKTLPWMLGLRTQEVVGFCHLEDMNTHVFILPACTNGWRCTCACPVPLLGCLALNLPTGQPLDTLVAVQKAGPNPKTYTEDFAYSSLKQIKMRQSCWKVETSIWEQLMLTTRSLGQGAGRLLPSMNRNG